MTITRSPLSQKAIGCAITVHKLLGPGLFESTYATCLAHELTLEGVPFEREVPVPLIYKGTLLDCGYRIDFLLERTLVLELKTVDAFVPAHSAQVATYLRFLPAKQGLLINFNVVVLRHGLKRVVL